MLTQDVWQLEQRVTGGHLGDPEKFLEEMFRARHGLLTVETMAALSREVYARMAKIEAFGDGRGGFVLEDSVDQFDRLRAMADGQKDYLQGTIEFYQARTNTKMTIAAERLAVIAAVTLPITALSSILGMNVIVNDETQYEPLAVALVIMIVMSIMLLIWAKRKGWSSPATKSSAKCDSLDCQVQASELGRSGGRARADQPLRAICRSRSSRPDSYSANQLSEPSSSTATAACSWRASSGSPVASSSSVSSSST